MKLDKTTPYDAFLNFAREYHFAARTLQPLEQEAHSPVYFLFTQTVELALKAFLRSRGVAIPCSGWQGHALQDLLSQCRENGLPVSLDLLNVVRGLESEARKQGFRYFLFENMFVPEIDFLSETVDLLMREIEERVRGVEGDVGGQPGAVLRGVFGKPEEKNPEVGRA